MYSAGDIIEYEGGGRISIGTCSLFTFSIRIFFFSI